MRFINTRSVDPGFFPHAAAAIFLVASVVGCGGGGSGGDGGGTPTPTVAVWQASRVADVAVGGLTTARVDVAVDTAGVAHLAFFEGVEGSATTFELRYVQWDPAAPEGQGLLAEESVTVLDNCGGLDLSLDGAGRPTIAYRGGALRACGAARQADAMVSIREAAGWSEYTAGIGEVERNPVFQDGLAGSEVGTATGPDGDLHVVYQFNYEGCDAMNFRYPDLLYVRMDPLNPSGVLEETVEGNDYQGSNEQNSVGFGASVVVDSADRPVVVYYAELPDGTVGLRAARREGGVWVREWIETGCEVGAISAARRASDGRIAVAYYVTGYVNGRDDVHCLRYVEEGDGGWGAPRMIDDRTWCGSDCSLAFDPDGNPAVAYRAMQTHTGYDLLDLMLARFDGQTWATEKVASVGDIGQFNTLAFDAAGRTAIFTYSNNERAIFLYRK